MKLYPNIHPALLTTPIKLTKMKIIKSNNTSKPATILNKTFWKRGLPIQCFPIYNQISPQSRGHCIGDQQFLQSYI